MTTAERLRAEGEAIGEARGEGRARTETLIDLLDAKFGSVPGQRSGRSRPADPKKSGRSVTAGHPRKGVQRIVHPPRGLPRWWPALCSRAPPASRAPPVARHSVMGYRHPRPWSLCARRAGRYGADGASPPLGAHHHRESHSSGPDTIKRPTSAEPIRLPRRSALSPQHHAHRQRSPTTEAGAFRGCAFAQSGSNGLISVVTPTATPLPARPTHETGQILTPKVLPADPLDPRNEKIRSRFAMWPSSSADHHPRS